MSSRNNLGMNKSSSSKVSDKQLTGRMDNIFKSSKTFAELENDITKMEKANIAASHDQRLTDLRDIADELKEDSWKYPAVETLLGLPSQKI